MVAQGTPVTLGQEGKEDRCGRNDAEDEESTEYRDEYRRVGHR